MKIDAESKGTVLNVFCKGVEVYAGNGYCADS